MFWFVREFYSPLERVASYLSINKPVGDHAPVLPLQHKCVILCESQLHGAVGDVAPATSASAESVLAHAWRWLIGDSKVNKVHPDVGLLLNCKGQTRIASSLTCSLSRKHKSDQIPHDPFTACLAPHPPNSAALPNGSFPISCHVDDSKDWLAANVVSGQGNSAIVSVSRLHMERNVM